MRWDDAKYLIQTAMVIGSDINTSNSNGRKIVAVDVHLDQYDYDNSLGFQIQIGKRVTIDIPWTMLEKCFYQLNTENGYNSKSYGSIYQTQKKAHGCHVHVIGQMLARSGIAEIKGNPRSPSYFLKK